MVTPWPVMRMGRLPPLPPDCPQVQCVHPYVAQQPDELTLELADILNILDKTEDGEAGGRVRCPPVPPRTLLPACTSPRMQCPGRRSWLPGGQARAGVSLLPQTPLPAPASPAPPRASALLPGPARPSPAPTLCRPLERPPA